MSAVTSQPGPFRRLTPGNENKVKTKTFLQVPFRGTPQAHQKLGPEKIHCRDNYIPL
jgi:hypothetical protein